MLLSMTGFGKGVVTIPGKKITVELKSLNSKQFDMSARIPSAYRELELEMRRRVASRLERGKVDMICSVEHINGGTAPANIDIEAAAAYKKQVENLRDALGLPYPTDWYSILLRLPEVVAAENHCDLTKEETDAVIKCLDEAIDGLMAHRRTEGEKLEDFFALRLRKITDMLTEVPRWEKERIEKIHIKLEEGLAKIPQAQIDRGRLEQEMIFYIEKLDVNEERQRLGQHLIYFAETMALPTPGQGKKLGFIAQEMGREINTLGSKSNHAEMQKLVVKMKDELEQIKEQVLNVM
ncbi:MAG: YicC family protein [Bacteroides sp.]|nr:YicC family protein [Bacteroides sp.]MCM1379861.1 YicC family protein [Bacteroides sp.]MCM1446107.1 YicC family protein [Prevotella sp.]